MKQQLAATMLTLTAALWACRDADVVAGPAADRLKWGWDKPLGTSYDSPTLICSPTTVSHLGSVTCSFAGGGILNLPFWHFEAEGGFNVQGPGATAQWTGNMVVGGDVVADWVDFDTGLQYQLRKTITVQRRNLSWASTVGGTAALAGTMGGCFLEAWDGLTMSRDCSSSNDADQFFIPKVASVDAGNGYSATVVTGSGPNAGLWFVDQMTADMDLRSQISARYQDPGTLYALTGPGGSSALSAACATAYPSATVVSVYQANVDCTSNSVAFGGLVTCIWGHEARHLIAGIDNAKLSQNDVYAKWEGIVAASLSSLRDKANDIYDEVHSVVRSQIVAAHNTGPPNSYTGWWRIYNYGWDLRAYSQYC